MNYLKKKIKTVVHGPNHKRKDDDDDFDNYVPEVPPHPSTLADNELNNNNNNSINFANFDANTFSTESGSFFPLPLPKEPEPELSLDDLKAKEEEHKKQEREKLKQLEESKKDLKSEDWQFFLSLTAKADAVTSKTQSSLNKLQEESAVKDINKFDDITYSDRFDPLAAKKAGNWAAFEESDDYNPADPILTLPEQEENKEEPNKKAEKKNKEPVIDEETQRIARELIEDFGFSNPAPGIPLVADKIENVAEEPNIDPFDTSFIDIEAIRSGEVVSKPTLIKDIDVGDIDPFDTSYIESTIKQDLTIKD